MKKVPTTQSDAALRLHNQVVSRALQSEGISLDSIYGMVLRAMEDVAADPALLVDLGCGRGDFLRLLKGKRSHLVGIDVVKHDGFPSDSDFVLSNLDSGEVPLSDESADVVTAIEVIEHVENPRALMRELARITKSGGWLFVTTPNQLSLLSKLCLVLKNRFASFSERDYPAHITALLEIDLRRMANECGLRNIQIRYGLNGRIPLTTLHYPKPIAALWPRGLSDNLLLMAQK